MKFVILLPEREGSGTLKASLVHDEDGERGSRVADTPQSRECLEIFIAFSLVLSYICISG
jgi:hypothetical protein